MKATKMTFSYHCTEDRMNRLVFIAEEIGWGEVVLETTIGDKRECITSTGVLLVKALKEEFLITAYVPSIDKACAVYQSSGHKFPQSMAKIIKHNTKLFQKKYRNAP